ncbi:MAG: hypothetical protein ACRD2Z_02340 [Thermoanaerobaculia bacterium]
MSNPTSSVPPPRRDVTAGASGDPSGDQPTLGNLPPPRRDHDEVERLLADARVRVQQTLDESVAKAEELLAQRWTTVRGRLLAEIRRTLADLADLLEGMAEVRDRLVGIEALLQQHDPAADQSPEPLPTGRRLASVPPLPARPDRPPPSVVSPEATEASAPPAHPGHGQPTASLPRPGGAEPAPAAPRQPQTAESEPATQTQPAPGSTPGADAFQPDRGAVLLRVDPVAGFQELMRVQDVLGRIEGIRQATAEAYEQGEARLRLELSAPMRPAEIATGLRHGLQQPAEVRNASIEERTLQITLGAGSTAP